MKKSLILPITLAALLMTGCDTSSVPAPVSSSEAPQSSSVVDSSSEAPTSSSAEATHTVSITNKADLQAEWAVTDGARTVTVTATPEIEDINDALDDGLISFASSNSEIVSVARNKIAPVAVGTATITVTYGDATDSVEVSVIAQRSAQSLYGTVHAGTAEDPFDNADAIKVAKEHTADQTSVAYYVKGTVNGFYHFPGERSYATSWFIETTGEETENFECYNINTGEKVNNDNVGPDISKVYPGAVVTAVGKIKCYNGTCEMNGGTYVSTEAGEGPAAFNTVTDKTISEVITAVKALPYDGDSLYDWYTVTGYVQAVSGADYKIADEKLGEDETPDATKILTVKNYDIETLGVEEGSVTDKIETGAKVQITLRPKNYHGDAQGIMLNSKFKVLEAGSAVEATEMSFDDAMTAVKALDDNASQVLPVKVTAYVCKKTIKTDSGVTTCTVFIAKDPKETTEKNMLIGYAMTSTKYYDLINVGDTVAIEGVLTKYVSGNYTAYRLASGKMTPVLVAKNVTDALAIGNALEGGDQTNYKVATTGFITDIGSWSDEYSNVFKMKIADKADETEAAKQLVILKFTNKTVYETLKLGDKIIVTSSLLHYVKKDGQGTVTESTIEAADTDMSIVIAPEEKFAEPKVYGDYTQLVKAADLTVGSTVVLAYTSVDEQGALKVGKEMSGMSKDGESGTYATVADFTTAIAGTYKLDVVAGTAEGSFAFKHGDYYLSYLGTKNHVSTSTTLDAEASWKVTFNEDGDAIVTNVGDTTRILQYNTATPRFACYTGSQVAVEFYK